MAKVFVTKDFSFEAAHHLLGYDGDCAKMHGHSYKLSVTVSGDIQFSDFSNRPASEFMVMDFKDLNRLVKEKVVNELDHSVLNDVFVNPTAELMVVVIFRTIARNLPADVKLESVKLWETSTSYAEYKGG